MHPELKKDILDMLEKGTLALREMDSSGLREISDHTIHSASIYQDKNSVIIAVAMYSLSKVVERSRGKEQQELLAVLEDALDKLQKDDIGSYEQAMKNLMEHISELDKKLKMYIHHVISEAEIKKGSRIYEHGISLAQTAELLGTTQWELMRYIGQTQMADRFEDEITVQERLEHTRGLFGL